jgi:7-keto-8-aminopelargonate synthetase-like enzyme
MKIKTEQGFRGYWTASKGNKVIARHNSLTLLEQELKARGYTEHRVKFYKGGERVYSI